MINKILAGVDEVGRGCLAGPVVSCAVILRKSINPNIKTIHYVAPQVWVWREGRGKNFKLFLDHVLLLFNFE